MAREEFIGFSFNKRHSSEFNIVRTSDGSRFKYNLTPDLQNKTVAVPGGDGSYLFGTTYTQRPHNISFAYDNLTEGKLIELTNWLRADQVGELIFDEWPHKAWDVKISAPPTISFIPFEEGGQRIYKGEGTISFIAYQAFAHNPEGKKWLNDYDSELHSFLTIYKLADNSGNTYDQVGDNVITVFNAGNKPTPFNLTFLAAEGKFTLSDDNKGLLNFTIPVTHAGKRFRINTKLHLFEDLKEEKTSSGIVVYTPSGVVYNDWITGGNFFKLEPGKSELVCSRVIEKPDTGEIELARGLVAEAIDYKYLYF